MPVSTGTKLGPYEIVARIGAGGMGEVFRAKDTRLQRTVAIKVLSADVDARRFQQEARAASELNHPAICTLFDVGNHGGTDFLVMEYLDGETLAERLRRGPLPRDQALQLASELLDGLAHAHRNGIIHRDLKPHNIMLVRTGSRITAKILDFGLAKRAAAAAEDRTATIALTQKNVVVGTPKYMAPEQLEGRPADVRSDVYAMGLVLQQLLPAASTPEMVQQVVRRSVAREPDERWQSAADFRAALALAQVPASLPQAGRSRTRTFVAAALAAASIAVLIVLLLFWPRRDRAVDPIAFSFGAPGRTTLAPWPGVPSPDGRRIAFIARDEAGQTSLWIRSLAAEVAHHIPGTETASGPFWSPDGRLVGFFAQGKLKKVDLSGGPPQNICNAIVDLGATWSPSGDIIFAPVNRTVLHRVPAAGELRNRSQSSTRSVRKTHIAGRIFFPMDVTFFSPRAAA